MPAGSKALSPYGLDLSSARAANDPYVIDGLWSAVIFTQAVDDLSVLNPTGRMFVRLEQAGPRIPLRVGQSIRADDTKRWYFDWPAQPGVTATLLFVADVGVANFLPLQPTVAALPLDRLQTLGGRHFVGHAEGNNVAGEYANAQLSNPTGSGRLVLLRRVVLSAAGTAGTVEGFITTGTLLADHVAGWQGNKLGAADSAAPLAKVRSDEHADAFSTRATATRWMRFPLGADEPFVFETEPAIVLEPAFDLTFWFRTVNVGMGVTFQWEEVDG